MKTEPLFSNLSEELELLKDSHLFRKLRTLESLDSTHAKLNGKEIRLFCHNDYLGLSKHPEVVEAFLEGVKNFGAGSGAARLISGNTKVFEELEEGLARFKRKERALLFSTGYLANLGVISAFCEKNDVVIVDKLNHASIIDACKLSGATIRVYPHKDLNYLEKILKQSNRFRKKLIVTDSVFSMDGDLAPLPEIAELKNRYGAYLMIDEAHGTGVFGKSGRGAAELLGVEDDIDISMGTLSKAFGTHGGFVAGKKELIDYLINKSRTFIFSTTLPPAVCAASLKSLELIEKKPEIRQSLWERVKQTYDGLASIGIKTQDTFSPIIPIIVGDEQKALTLSETLLQKGILIPAVRFPTVPKKTARLRLTISAAHTKSDVDFLISALKNELS